MEDLTKSRVFWSGCGWGVFEKNYCLYGAMCVCINDCHILRFWKNVFRSVCGHHPLGRNSTDNPMAAAIR